MHEDTELRRVAKLSHFTNFSLLVDAVGLHVRLHVLFYLYFEFTFYIKKIVKLVVCRL